MKWLGEKLKEIVTKSGFTQSKISDELNISRQTYIDWTKGQIPKGNHLLKLCRLLKLNPTELFEEEYSNITVPLHMTRGTAKLTDKRQNLSLDLAKEYENVINSSKSPALQFTVKSVENEFIPVLAQNIRQLAGLEQETDKPLDYQHVFRLLDKLGICLVFRKFPIEIKSYGFFTEINSQRTVFINTSTSVIDLIFPLLHELIHAIIERKEAIDITKEQEEEFCNKVAGLAQFPDKYINLIYENIKALPSSHKINNLKNYSRNNHHAMYGVVKAIEEKYGKLNINTGGADTNLKKELPKVIDILNHSEDAEDFLSGYKALSPIFYELLLENYDNFTDRKLGEILDLDNFLDASAIRKVLDKQKRLLNK